MSGKRRISRAERLENSRRAVRFFSFVAFVLVLGIQSARVIQRNISVAHDVQLEEQQIQVLQHQKDLEKRTILRLQRPDGVIPEIHNRLKYARDNEAIVFLRHPGDGANALVGP